MSNSGKYDPRISELSNELKEFLVPEDERVEMYSHRTASEEIADKILDEGFIFTESFQKTTDQIINDLVYLRYWDSLRKHYGSFIIVIGISKKVFVEVMEKLKSKFEVQQALSEFVSGSDEFSEDDFVFKLPKEYVKGYIKRETGDIILNKAYNPNFIPKILDKNVDFLNNL